MLMLLSIIWLEMVTICSLLTAQAILTGVIKTQVVEVHSGVKALLTKIGTLPDKDQECKLQVFLMVLMISIVPDL